MDSHRAVSGAFGSSIALVGGAVGGSAARALLDYHDLRVTTFLIRGYAAHPA